MVVVGAMVVVVGGGLLVGVASEEVVSARVEVACGTSVLVVGSSVVVAVAAAARLSGSVSEFRDEITPRKTTAPRAMTHHLLYQDLGWVGGCGSAPCPGSPGRIGGVRLSDMGTPSKWGYSRLSAYPGPN
jgi:hypothetical protein